MSFDTKYRPLLFSEVIGQRGTVKVLKKLVQTDQVFHKSYIFAGPSGTGKTTTARILARAMLCDDVTPEGEPCNQCDSCREIIEGTSSFSYVEMDAANNSNVDTIRGIVESIDYYTLNGKDRRIYLLDEAHRLSKEAMDALLKPMEDNVPGSKDKRLVCLFCTTEPEKLRDTIKARCMMFGIKEAGHDEVIERLKFICEEEAISYEDEALDIIFSYGKGHIRDMVSALERVSQIGPVTPDNVREQLGLGAVSNYYRILDSLRDDLPEALSVAQETLRMVDPPTLYEGLADAALASYRVACDITEGIGYVDIDRAKGVYGKYADEVLWIADRILGSNKRVDSNVLISELVLLHRYLNDGTIFATGNVQKMKPPQPVRGENSSESSDSESGGTETAPEGSGDSTTTTTTPTNENPSERVQRWRDEASGLSRSAAHFVNPDGPNGSNDGDEDETKTPTTSEVRHYPGEVLQNLRRSIFND